jgi:GT2 family glycosyltransferase
VTTTTAPDLSVIIVSFNTRELLDRCLRSVEATRGQGVRIETIVVDNASRDGSAEMVRTQHPETRLIESGANLGFAAANNLAYPSAMGRYIVLLNSDAFLSGEDFRRAVDRMNAMPDVGIAGGRLVGEDGAWQPSARLFPSAINDALRLSGLADRYSKSRFFGRADRTWASDLEPADVDWVPGAFSILRREAIDRVGFFDERFFLYYEEVDLCRRVKEAGFRVAYWPDIVVTHIGGASGRKVENQSFSKTGGQLTLWRMRSALLYYRKHHGLQGAWGARWLEEGFHRLRSAKNRRGNDPISLAKLEESDTAVRLLHQAWRETEGGVRSPPRPW